MKETQTRTKSFGQTLWGWCIFVMEVLHYSVGKWKYLTYCKDWHKHKNLLHPGETETESHTSLQSPLLFPATWPAAVNRGPRTGNTLSPTSTSDLRAAHVPLNIAKGRRRLHQAKPAAEFIIFRCDLWPTGRGRTEAVLLWLMLGPERNKGKVWRGLSRLQSNRSVQICVRHYSHRQWCSSMCYHKMLR